MKCFNFIIHIHFGSGHLGILYEKVRYSLGLEEGGGLVMWIHDAMENTVKTCRGEVNYSTFNKNEQV